MYSDEAVAQFSREFSFRLYGAESPREALVELRSEPGLLHLRGNIRALLERLDQGQSLSQALSSQPLYSLAELNLIEVGESAGRLDEVLSSIAGARSLRQTDKKFHLLQVGVVAAFAAGVGAAIATSKK